MSLRTRIQSSGIPVNTLAALATGNGIRVYAQDVYRWADGVPGISQAKIDRLEAWLVQIEHMLSVADFRPEMRDPTSVLRAIERLESQELRESAGDYCGGLFAATVGASQ